MMAAQADRRDRPAPAPRRGTRPAPTVTTPMLALAWTITEHPDRYLPDARALARLILEATGDMPSGEPR